MATTIFMVITQLLMVVLIVVLRYKLKKKSDKYVLMQKKSEEKLTNLYSVYYKLSSSYINLTINYLNLDSTYIDKMYDKDRESILGLICMDINMLTPTAVENIGDLLFDKITIKGEEALTKNERMFLDIYSQTKK